ncbi:hypothetical protein [Flavobacterium sp.]|uniref:hypothetical protein n=1 Tax=Flavobacterium sp. TaxID=239 RepID=UPI00286C8EB0|nr:hypothetical protein [Flavobacterium sp.]
MKKLIVMFFIISSCLSFYVLKSKNQNHIYNVAFVQEMYIDKGSYRYYNEDSTYTKGENSNVKNFIGIFPKLNDTVTIYKLNTDKSEKAEKFNFWSKKNKAQSITFFCSGEEVKVTFGNKNDIIVNSDKYVVNNEYYNFLKQKVFVEASILDLTFFLKDGYGDYAQMLDPLNKNWRNQKENNTHKIISATIKNKNNQTDDQYFNYKFIYKYDENGVLKSIEGENRYNKNFINNTGKYIQYSILNGENERSLTEQILYKNKKTLFDSIVGNIEQYSISKTKFYTKYQSKLKILVLNKKPRNINEIFKILDIKNPN